MNGAIVNRGLILIVGDSNLHTPLARVPTTVGSSEIDRIDATIPPTRSPCSEADNARADAKCIWHHDSFRSRRLFIGIDRVNNNMHLITFGISHAPYQDGLKLVVRGPEELLCWISTAAFK